MMSGSAVIAASPAGDCLPEAGRLGLDSGTLHLRRVSSDSDADGKKRRPERTVVARASTAACAVRNGAREPAAPITTVGVTKTDELKTASLSTVSGRAQDHE